VTQDSIPLLFLFLGFDLKSNENIFFKTLDGKEKTKEK